MPEKEKPVHPRKIEIVEAAVTCFLERGYHQTGVRDIAKQAGVSLGNLYNHFKGKEDVLAFIAEIEVEETGHFIELLVEPNDPLAALEQFIYEYAIYISHPENALLGVEILTEAIRNPMISDVFGKNRTRLVDALVSCLNKGIKLRVFASYDDLSTIAFMMLDTLEGRGIRNLEQSTIDETSIRSLQSFILNGLKL
ncbi:TetR/AcrR family transcriptional regulator [uncultured Maritalea sp.]|jgi:AcrR family transcriptional regulator|uniref:TetR/AcrR family transcriptional regulator n=1 Tax=uncultured Maritalea sp. TaxID=757249 RepID=UPI00260D9E19|nr:TetR/AcrR family transcriptional regulator [uncultured Maritalea sp.]